MSADKSEKNDVAETSENCFLPAVATAPIQRGRPFRAGVSGNPNGRPPGSKNRLTEAFMSAITEDFAANGERALARVRRDDPVAYLKLIGSFVPRELVVQRERDTDFFEWSVSEIEDLLQRARHNQSVNKLLQSAKNGRT